MGVRMGGCCYEYVIDMTPKIEYINSFLSYTNIHIKLYTYKIKYTDRETDRQGLNWLEKHRKATLDIFNSTLSSFNVIKMCHR